MPEAEDLKIRTKRRWFALFPLLYCRCDLLRVHCYVSWLEDKSQTSQCHSILIEQVLEMMTELIFNFRIKMDVLFHVKFMLQLGSPNTFPIIYKNLSLELCSLCNFFL